jgi:4-amino-4-deoxy-L-arabinose transferase-like glycosyltransferase
MARVITGQLKRCEDCRPEMLPRGERFFVIAIAVLCGLWQAFTLRNGHDWGDDFAQYIVHASNMLHGAAYGAFPWVFSQQERLYFPGNYPPGFPLMLVPIIGIFGVNLTAMKLLSVIAFSAALVIIYFCVRRFIPMGLALASIVIIGLNPFFWEFKDNVLSDIPFLLFVYISLYVFTEKPPVIGHTLAAAGAIIGAYAIRNAGVVLLGVPIVSEIVRKRSVSRRGIAVVCIAGCGVLVLSKMFEMNGGYYSFIDNGLEQWSSSFKQAINYFVDLNMVWDNTRNRKFFYAVAAIISFLAGAGFVSRLRRDRFSEFEAFIICYVPLIVFWPAYQGTRLCIPLIPLFVFYAMVSIDKIEKAFGGTARMRQWRNVPLAVLLVLVAGTYSLRYVRKDIWRINDSIYSHDSMEMSSWVRTHVPDRGRVAFRKPRALALLTGKRTTGYDGGSDDSIVIHDMRDAGVTHVMVSDIFEEDRRWLRPFILRHPELFSPVFSNVRFTIMGMNADAGRGCPQ